MSSINCQLDAREDTTYDLFINKDRTLNQLFEAYFESGGTEYAFDFSSYSGASLEVRKNYDSNYIVLEFSTEDGSITLGLDGQFTLTKTAEELENIRAEEYVYDMYLSSSSAAKRAFISGRFIISNRVTR